MKAASTRNTRGFPYWWNEEIEEIYLSKEKKAIHQAVWEQGGAQLDIEAYRRAKNALNRAIGEAKQAC